MQAINKLVFMFMLVFTYGAFAQSPIKLPMTTSLDHRGGNGGDTIASEVSAIANNIALAWAEICEDSVELFCNYLIQYQDMLDHSTSNFVRVRSAFKVHAFDDQERDAVNFYDNGVGQIVINASKWLEDKNNIKYGIGNHHSTITLITHEYLSLMQVETSDYYNLSKRIAAAIEATGYDLSLIASSKILPSKCSLYLKDDKSLNETLKANIKSIMTQKGYHVSKLESHSRYTMRTTLHCDKDSIILNACSVYVEVNDQIKNKNKLIYDRLETLKGWRNKKKVINQVFNEALKDIPSCHSI